MSLKQQSGNIARHTVLDAETTRILGDRKIRLGTRGSKLAVKQSIWVAERLSKIHEIDVSLITISTPGDESKRPIEEIGSTGVFVTAVREVLARGEVDFVVHSFKDLPSQPESGLQVAGIPVREDPRDALVWRGGTGSLDDLPSGTRLGTGSPRRAAQLLARWPDLVVAPLRGNVDTRLRRISDGTVDAVLLAMAGLARLGRLDVVSSAVPATLLLPAPAQGALALECRADDAAVLAALSALDDPDSRCTVSAERAFLQSLGASCTAPVAAYGELRDDRDGRRTLVVDGLVASPDGRRVISAHVEGSADRPVELGVELAESVLRQGARAVLDESAPVRPSDRGTTAVTTGGWV